MPSNPFATRYTAPGKLPFLFREDLTTELLAKQLSAVGYRAQIVGPHGTGKSTLLRELITHLEPDFDIQEVDAGTYTDRNQISPVSTVPTQQIIIVIDGFEQLGQKLQRSFLHWVSSADVGLIITVHEPVELPILYETRAELQIFEKLVKHITGDLHVEAQLINDAFESHQGNVREALFTLYDHFGS